MQELGTTGNLFSAVAILAWPLVALAMYRTRTVAEATLITVLGGLLLLPTGVLLKLPMIPAIDKISVPNLCAFVGCALLAPRRRPAVSRWGFVELLALTLVVCPVVTSLLNGDTIIIGDRVLPGVGLYDGVSALLAQLVLFLPFIVGRRIFQEAVEAELVVRCLVSAGLLYSLPMLLEVRLSPQLSNWIYGVFPSGFGSEMRYGGYRPVVFMKNGLAAAFFIMTALLGAVALWRTNIRTRWLPAGMIAGYLSIVLILCKSAGAFLYGLFVGFAVAWTRPRHQLYLAAVLGAVSLLYPILRVTDMFPDKVLVEAASSVDQLRADSLKFRFDQEQQLLDHALQRFAFGWGRYGRNRTYDEGGNDSSITDGAWIQILGQFGLTGFLAQFGLLAWPIFCALSANKCISSERDRVVLSVIALIVALGLVEQLPNSSINSWTWLLAGALLGRTERLIAQDRIARSVGKFRSGAGSV